MSTFAVFTPIFAKVDEATATFVTDISSKAITTITPLVVTGLTIAFIVYGFLIIRGAVSSPVMDFLWRSCKIGLIAAFVLAGGLYQSQLQDVIMRTPDDLATALISNPSAGTTAPGVLDTAAGKGFDIAGEAFDKAGIFVEHGFVYAFFGGIILLSTGVLVAIGGAWLLLAKVALALLVGLGPLFLCALFFDATRRFFELWLGQVLNYILLVVLFSAVFGLMMSLFGTFMSNIKFDGLQNEAYNIGGTVMLAVAMIVILMRLPGLASALAGGVSIGGWHDLRGLGGAGKAGYRGGKSVVSNSATRAIGRGAVAGAVIGGQAVASGAKKAAGYFRGRAA